jgi:hypothetical protein
MDFEAHVTVQKTKVRTPLLNPLPGYMQHESLRVKSGNLGVFDCGKFGVVRGKEKRMCGNVEWPDGGRLAS